MTPSQSVIRDVALTRELLTDVCAALTAIDPEEVTAAAEIIASGLAKGRRVLLLGNGGSCATASHLATDLTLIAVEARLCASVTALYDNPCLVTALANDYGFAESGVRLIETNSSPGDVLLILSCSGHSANVVNAARTAAQRGVATILLGSFIAPSDFPACPRILVQSPRYSVIEVVHNALAHLIVDVLRARFGLRLLNGVPRVATGHDVDEA
jgi:D-sedoheptulose 7-phosphate isomerase